MTAQGLMAADVACTLVLLLIVELVRRHTLHLECGIFLALPIATVLVAVNLPGLMRVIVAPLDSLFAGAGLAVLSVVYFFAGLFVMGLQLCRLQARQRTLAQHLAIQRALVEARSRRP
jgi:hypothetical protein